MKHSDRSGKRPPREAVAAGKRPAVGLRLRGPDPAGRGPALARGCQSPCSLVRPSLAAVWT